METFKTIESCKYTTLWRNHSVGLWRGHRDAQSSTWRYETAMIGSASKDIFAANIRIVQTIIHIKQRYSNIAPYEIWRRFSRLESKRNGEGKNDIHIL